MKHSIIINSKEKLAEASRLFINEIGDKRIVAFYAPMGAGKTTFTTALCRALGVADDEVNSPTFSIVNEYRDSQGESIYHFDFYRIEKLEEALDIGFYDYIDSGSYCFMEWPENIEGLLPEETLKVYITVNSDESRELSWED